MSNCESLATGSRAGNFVDSLYDGSAFPLSVGVDPHWELIPEVYLAKGQLQSDAVLEGVFAWMCDVMEAVSGLARVLKFQSAFFEQLGSVGACLLAKGVAEARRRGFLILLDAKRGDIGSTAQAYASYLEGGLRGSRGYASDIVVDAMTLNPFLGDDTLEPFKAAVARGRGVFVLVRTSNDGSVKYQNAKIGEQTVAMSIANFLDRWSLDAIGACGFSSVGAVIGATFPDEMVAMRTAMPRVLFLIPGVGAQGGDAKSIVDVVDERGRGALVSISRAVIFPGRVDELSRASAVRGAIRNACEKYVELLRSVGLG